ncbi:MAG: hypothetical protein ABIQ52_19160, partial [Vicinamibacterales bacterium]
AGVSRPISKMVSLNATYAHTSGENLMRGSNLNAPLNGQRPDPAFANVVQVLGDARSRANTLNIGASINFNVAQSGAGGSGMMMMGDRVMFMGGGPAPGGAATARWNWRRMQVFSNLSLGRTLNNTDGPFSLPATGRIEDDWGPSGNDVRRRFNLAWSSSQLRNFNANLNVNVSGAAPYTVRSGFDSNADLNFNDRPGNYGRNSARGIGQWSVNGFFTYSRQFGRPVQMPGGVNFRAEGGAMTVTQGAASNAGRYRVSFNVNVQNLTNHANLTGFITRITAPDFGRPTSSFGTRKIDIGMGISF